MAYDPQVHEGENLGSCYGIFDALTTFLKGKAVSHLGIPGRCRHYCTPTYSPVSKGLGPEVARIQPIPKKGDLTMISSYRPIALTEVLRRVFEGMLVAIVSANVEPLALEQGVFRRGRGTLDQARDAWKNPAGFL